MAAGGLWIQAARGAMPGEHSSTYGDEHQPLEPRLEQGTPTLAMRTHMCV